MRMRQLIVPGVILIVAFGLLQPWAHVPEGFWPLLRFYSWFIAGAGVLLAWGFQRGRVALGLLVLALAGEGLHALGAGTIGAARNANGVDTATLLYDMIAVLLPLNLAWIVCVNERGLFSARGLGRLGLIAAQAGATAWIMMHPWPKMAGGLSGRWIPLPWSLETPLRQGALLAFGVALGATGFVFWRRARPIEAGFMGALAGAFLALHMPVYTPRLPSDTLFIAAAQTILSAGLLLNSHAMAYRDELTGVPSRRALNELLAQLGRQYVVAMVDVDHFKKFNDRYGHDTGDQVLRMIAAKLSRVQGGGKAFRYGGEEFTIVFPGKGLEAALVHLDQVRKTIEQEGFMVRGAQQPGRMKAGERRHGKGHKAVGADGKGTKKRGEPARVKVTVSLGVAEASAKLDEPGAVIKAADKALYRAKKAGRNRISA